jgi:anti-sigma factor ChrR (cupin superfamily)
MLNLDFSKHVFIDSHLEDWHASPMPGVWRKRLAREDAEQGHATSIVKYEAGASFNSHPHPLGEEIFVLDGIFSDETGNYPAGTYLRNPEGFEHAPFSKEGCTLFVKLHQFQPEDRSQVRIDTRNTDWLPGIGHLKIMPLHQFSNTVVNESVTLVFWPAGEHFQSHTHFSGEEILVISGEFIDENGRYPAGSWLRSPHMSKHNPHVEQDTVILVKVGHLPAV